jgi:hypothetical protein
MAGVLVLTVAAWRGVSWYQSVYGTPSCSWPAQIRGAPTGEQSGLVRCYLEALATRDTGEMSAVARTIPPTRITSSLFLYSRDARSGTASVTIEPNPVDSTYAFVTIRYANGVVEQTGMLNMIAMGGPSTWRMDTG